MKYMLLCQDHPRMRCYVWLAECKIQAGGFNGPVGLKADTGIHVFKIVNRRAVCFCRIKMKDPFHKGGFYIEFPKFVHSLCVFLSLATLNALFIYWFLNKPFKTSIHSLGPTLSPSILEYISSVGPHTPTLMAHPALQCLCRVGLLQYTY